VQNSWDLDRARGELDADGGLRVEGEGVLGEAGEQVGLAHAGVADEHHLEEVVVLVAALLPRRRPPSHAFAAPFLCSFALLALLSGSLRSPPASPAGRAPPPCAL